MDRNQEVSEARQRLDSNQNLPLTPKAVRELWRLNTHYNPKPESKQSVSFNLGRTRSETRQLQPSVPKTGDEKHPKATRIVTADPQEEMQRMLDIAKDAFAGEDDEKSESNSMSSSSNNETASSAIGFEEFALLVAESCLVSNTDTPTVPEDQQALFDNGEFDKIAPEFLKYLFDCPTAFKAAWNHPIPWARDRWRQAILKELRKMEEHRVWKKIKLHQKPQKKKVIKCKWVFEVKRNGVFRARLVACGYSQIPGEDFQLSFSPVANDATIRLVLLFQIVMKLTARLFDIETAFLHGLLGEEEQVYMMCPEGMPHEKDECLHLLKTLYGLVQAARAFFLRLRTVLIEAGFAQSAADPCLFSKRSKYGPVFVVIHVDDCYCVGSEEGLKDLKQGLEKAFTVKVEETLNDYLSCEILINQEEGRAWIGQPHLLKRLDTNFGDLVKSKQEYLTPGTPNITITKVKEGEPGRVSKAIQSKYRSGVGMLLYLVKHSRPDIANAVRELSKAMDGANEGAWKELLRVIKYVLSTRDFGLNVKPTFPNDGSGKWAVRVFSDSDWAGDRVSRLSISGYILYVLGVPIIWRSKGQSSVALSSAEAEYYALSEAAKEIKFIAQLLETMGIKVQQPIIVHVDNMGAIYMSENEVISSRTKHIDIRRHFIRECIVDGLVKIQFVRSENNTADIFTKNTSSSLHNKHTRDLVISKPVQRKGVGHQK